MGEEPEATNRGSGLKLILSQSQVRIFIMMCILKGNPQYTQEIYLENTYKLSSAWVQFEM